MNKFSLILIIMCMITPLYAEVNFAGLAHELSFKSFKPTFQEQKLTIKSTRLFSGLSIPLSEHTQPSTYKLYKAGKNLIGAGIISEVMGALTVIGGIVVLANSNNYRGPIIAGTSTIIVVA